MKEGSFYTSPAPINNTPTTESGDGENKFKDVISEPISTFSIDADGASYSNFRHCLTSGQIPSPTMVRVEEFINYFTFKYAEPTNGQNVGLNSEISSCPWNKDHYLMRIGIKGKTIPENELPNSNYVFLIDVSGSMSSSDKLSLLKTGFKMMTDELRDDDRVAIVTYAGAAAVLLQSTSGSEKVKIKAAIDKLGAGGSTAGAAGIKTAYEIAQQNFISDGNNRVILGTDGDFNVGVSSTEELVKLIQDKRKTGVYLTVLGVGSVFNDHMMEQLADKGNGNYEYIDNVKQLQKVFIYEKSRFHTVAKDSKIQITFNPDMVSSYRLIGYENRALNTKDFKDDSTDAGELGSAQTITALYEVVLKKKDASAEYATFDFRYKMPHELASRLLNLKIQNKPKDILKASENMRFATAVTGCGLLVKNSAFKGTLTKQMILDLSNLSNSFDPNGYRKEFIDLVKKLN